MLHNYHPEDILDGVNLIIDRHSPLWCGAGLVELQHRRSGQASCPSLLGGGRSPNRSGTASSCALDPSGEPTCRCRWPPWFSAHWTCRKRIMKRCSGKPIELADNEPDASRLTTITTGGQERRSETSNTNIAEGGWRSQGWRPIAWLLAFLQAAERDSRALCWA